MVATPFTAEDFEKTLDKILLQARQQSLSEVTITSGELHRRVGGYPGKNHRMPVCCRVMREKMQAGDEILSAPPKGNGATLVIRYRVQRSTS